MPAILKVYQTGGTLPWMEPGIGQGQGWRIREDPMLEVGERYILFLKKPSDLSHNFQRLGYIPAEIGGVVGKDAELDEYLVTDHWRGKLLLKDGFTHAPADRGGNLHWRFTQGFQILDQPEISTLTAIRAAIEK
jgi:hypothetical protein